jgi:uncharacterized protein YggE
VPLPRCLATACFVASSTLAIAQTPDPCATAPQTCATLINTHASAETRLPSTAVDISVEVTANGKDLATVQRQLAQKSTALLAYLRGASVQRLVTTYVSFTPETKYSNSSADKTVGYDGSSRVTFRTTPDKAPDLLSGVLDHGANTINSTHFTPTEEEIAAAERELSAEATRTAIAEAQAIAKAAELHVVAVRSINVQSDQTEARDRVAFTDGFSGGVMKQRLAAPIATAAGEQVFSIRVDIIAAANQ